MLDASCTGAVVGSLSLVVFSLSVGSSSVGTHAGTPGQYWRTLEEVEAEGSNTVSRNAPSPWVKPYLHLFPRPCSCMQLDSFKFVVLQALAVSVLAVLASCLWCSRVCQAACLLCAKPD